MLVMQLTTKNFATMLLFTVTTENDSLVDQLIDLGFEFNDGDNDWTLILDEETEEDQDAAEMELVNQLDSLNVHYNITD